MNLTQLQAECGRLLNDPTNVRWVPDTLTIRLNEAQTIVQGLTSAVKTKETLTPVVDTATVSVDSDTLDIMMVRITRSNGDKEKLDGITREELDFRYPNWENAASGTPEVYWFDATNAQINLVPKPDSANAIASGLEVWGVLKPAALSAPTDIPFDSNTPMVPYHLALVHWAVAQCWLDDGTPEALAKSSFHRSGMLARPGEFEKHILRIREDFDAPTDIPLRIGIRLPEGGRPGSGRKISKSYPLG